MCTQEMLMDILRALASPNMDIRKKTLDISMDLITSRNIDEVHAHDRCIQAMAVWHQRGVRARMRVRACLHRASASLLRLC